MKQKVMTIAIVYQHKLMNDGSITLDEEEVVLSGAQNFSIPELKSSIVLLEKYIDSLTAPPTTSPR